MAGSTGEMLGLQVRDVNLLRRTVDVKRTYQYTRAGWVEGTPESDKSTRTVPLRRALVDDLTTYLAEPPHGDDPTAPLWPGRNYAGGGEWRGRLDWTTRMNYDSFYRRQFREAARAIGRPTLRFHDLRHTAASLFAASGMPLVRVARVLGHADAGMTYRVYLHFLPDDFLADMERLDAYIAPARRATQTAPLPLRRGEGE
ncbi:site-specific integrase [Protaetiibacter larvae]|uniref:Site-specific integrase n=1 Tax=Protaetiibacter larvae TaxID=2592654 RepID=A0A5C1YBI7_9MICO|nr:site-specific integrase [Protaetiibacter larvae]QEO10227.1 site-specific integrase [Protaetiibacter larvae]